MSVEKKTEIFKELIDYYNFEKLIEYSDYLDGISDFEREKLKRALKGIAPLFNKEFSSFQPNDFHPILPYFSNDALWSKQWIIWLNSVLSQILNANNFPSLHKRLISTSKFDEALSVIEATYRFLHGGFDISFDPPTQFGNKKREADILLINPETSEQIYVEVSCLGLSQTEQHDHEIWSIIAYFAPRFLFSGKILKPLSPDSFHLLKEQITQFYKNSHDEFKEFNKPGIIDLAIAPYKDRKMLELWCKERNFEVNAFGFPDSKSPIHRLATKLTNEQKQLPEGTPSIVYLKTKDFLFYINDKGAFMNELQEILHRRKHIFGLLLSEESLNRLDQTTFVKGLNIYISTPRGKNELLNDNLIFILNKYSEQKISPNILDKIIKSITLD